VYKKITVRSSSNLFYWNGIDGVYKFAFMLGNSFILIFIRTCSKSRMGRCTGCVYAAVIRGGRWGWIVLV